MAIDTRAQPFGAICCRNTGFTLTFWIARVRAGEVCGATRVIVADFLANQCHAFSRRGAEFAGLAFVVFGATRCTSGLAAASADDWFANEFIAGSRTFGVTCAGVLDFLAHSAADKLTGSNARKI